MEIPEITWGRHTADDVKCVVCTCGMVYRAVTQELGGVVHTRPLCPRYNRCGGGVDKVLPKADYQAAKAAQALKEI